MHHIFIDFENVHAEAFDGIETVNQPSTIYVIGSNSSIPLQFDLLSSANPMLVNWQFIKSENGAKDALDIQLASLVGCKVNGNPNDSFQIISKDKGYDSMVNFWRRIGIDISRANNILGITDEEEVHKTMSGSAIPKSGLETELRAILPTDKFSDDYILHLSELINNSDSLISFYRKMGKGKDDLEAYGLIKDLVKKEKKTENNSVKAKIKTEKNSTKKNENALTDRIKDLLGKDFPKKGLSKLSTIINSHPQLVKISNLINEYAGNSQKGSVIYRKLKPLLKELGKK